jgi:hypothetical protein
VPPWDDLHRLSEQELKLTNLVTTHAVGDVLPGQSASEAPVAALVPKSVLDRFVSGPADEATPEKTPVASVQKSTKTAEVSVPTGGVATTSAEK